MIFFGVIGLLWIIGPWTGSVSFAADKPDRLSNRTVEASPEEPTKPPDNTAPRGPQSRLLGATPEERARLVLLFNTTTEDIFL